MTGDADGRTGVPEEEDVDRLTDRHFPNTDLMLESGKERELSLFYDFSLILSRSWRRAISGVSERRTINYTPECVY